MTVIPDSSASSHYLSINTPMLNPIKVLNPMAFQISNGGILTSSETYNIDLPVLPKAARQGHLIPGLDQRSLISIGKLSNHGYTTLFNKDR